MLAGLRALPSPAARLGASPAASTSGAARRGPPLALLVGLGITGTLLLLGLLAAILWSR
ncbi:MAG: hypothetical protein GXP55_26415, partial [Deltaproteobacteria bacterium]|nr:hypothetical protein [Deltaproteobacteria bacterium]